ncbi:hypothetical protein [Bradyrhizobium sp. SYSU BS000235]|uniref:hypothetical protein n=1 Tax=Bradyrhizobium sp. SYSU BS000235 TaxID=3411332 RepID=UPI003C749E3A
MKKPFYLMAGIVAALFVILAVTVPLVTPKDQKKAISETISRGADERTIFKKEREPAKPAF